MRRRHEVDGMVGYPGAGSATRVELDHELRSSLIGIESIAIALHGQRDRLPAAEVDRLALAIAAEADRLRRLVAAGRAPRSCVDLAEVIGPAILSVRCSGVEVHATVPTGTWVDARGDAVAQVALALLDNARVHARGSAVEVRMTIEASATALYVEDRGPGIEVDARSLFQRGRRGAHSPGSGLGLFIARRLAVEQGGSLVATARPGGGASFVLRLPTAMPAWDRATTSCPAVRS